MSELQNAANPDWIKWGLGVVSFLAVACSSLIIYIFRNLKVHVDDIEKEMIKKYNFIRKKQAEDHDAIIRIQTEVDLRKNKR